MRITVNGKPLVCGEGATLLDVVLQLELAPEAIVAEHNRDLVACGSFAATGLAEGDSLELLHFVGGG
jgi:thiamine biosynthesis protein ThiS